MDPATKNAEQASALRGHARTAMRQSWSVFHPVPALYPVPALAFMLAGSLALGQPGPALLMAAGAFSSGFGAFQRLTRFRIAPMLLAALCMAIFTGLGTAVSSSPGVAAVVAGVAAFGLGLAASFGTGPWWVLLQGAIFLLVAASRPGDAQEAISRALLVLAGGATQGLVVSALRAIAPRGFPPLSSPTAAPPPDGRAEWIAQARHVLTPGSPEMRYALLLGLATTAAELIAQRLSLPNGYWMALTVLLVLRRGGAETVIRGVQRILGTLAGASLATLVAALLRPDPAMLVALITLSAWCAYAMQWVNYGTFSISVTSYIAFLFSLEGLPEAVIAEHRVVATLLGGLLGVAALAFSRLGGRVARLSV